MGIQQTPHTLLYLGAGRGSDLEIYLSAGPERVILVEPDPDAVRHLRGRAVEDDRVEVVEAAVSSESGTATLSTFNIRGFNSLRRPTGLLELYPGLRQTGQAEVTVRQAAELVQELKISGGKPHWLVVDAPGEQGAVLSNLHDAELLRRFVRVEVRAPKSPLFDGAAPLDTIAELLDGSGYEVSSADAYTDPDRPTWVFTLSEAKLENIRLRDELGRLQRERDDHAKAAEEQRQEMERLQSERDHLAQEVEERRNEIERVRREKDAQLEELRNDVSLAVKMQKARDADVRELQERYQAMFDQKKEQEELLVEVTERLNQASEYLHELEARGGHTGFTRAELEERQGEHKSE